MSEVSASKKDRYVFIDEIQLVTPVINPAFTNREIIIAKNTFD